jgi:hypothetical protein
MIMQQKYVNMVVIIKHCSMRFQALIMVDMRSAVYGTWRRVVWYKLTYASFFRIEQ